jgi:hypothetical protein
VIPGEHVLGLVGFQEAVAANVAQHPFSHGVLEALEELRGESGDFVETEAGFWILARITRDLLEEAIDHAEMKMEVGVQGRAEAVQKADGPERCMGWCGGRGLPQGGLEGPEQNVKDGAGGAGPVVEKGSEALGHGEDELAHRDMGKDMVHEVGGGLGHALGVA